jgi:tetratricopeptide (TPR) repeat protein
MAAVASPALAQTPSPAPAPAPDAASATPAAPAAKTPATGAAPAAAPPATSLPAPRGPNPYSPPVQKGDTSLLARDFDAAVAAYKQEIEKNPTAPLGHYRLGEAELARGNLAEAEIAWQTALRFAGTDESIKSKILFVLADVKERQKANDEAVTRWKDYEQHARATPAAKGFPATAVERVKRAEEWRKISADAAQVRDRIKKRLDEADASLRKTSK